jgi:hypothetical protein
MTTEGWSHSAFTGSEGKAREGRSAQLAVLAQVMRDQLAVTPSVPWGLDVPGSLRWFVHRRLVQEFRDAAALLDPPPAIMPNRLRRPRSVTVTAASQSTDDSETRRSRTPGIAHRCVGRQSGRAWICGGGTPGQCGSC